VSVVQAGNGQQAGTELRGRTDSRAGEKALDLAVSSDGATAGTLLNQRGIGRRHAMQKFWVWNDVFAACWQLRKVARTCFNGDCHGVSWFM
jgi:hypothetical protein